MHLKDFHTRSWFSSLASDVKYMYLNHKNNSKQCNHCNPLYSDLPAGLVFVTVM